MVSYWTPELESSTRREHSGGTEECCPGSDTPWAGGPAKFKPFPISVSRGLFIELDAELVLRCVERISCP